MEPRAGSVVRCAYCHDPAGDGAATCGGCRAVVHGDCLVLHGGCPTLGCGDAPALLARAHSTIAAPTSGPSLRQAGLLLAALGLCTSIAADGIAHLFWLGVGLTSLALVLTIASLTIAWDRRSARALPIVVKRSTRELPAGPALTQDSTSWRVGCALGSFAGAVLLPFAIDPIPGTIMGAVLAFEGARLAWQERQRRRRAVPTMSLLGTVDGWLAFDDPEAEVDRATIALFENAMDDVARLRMALAREGLYQGLEADLHLQFLLDTTRPGGLSALRPEDRALVRAIARCCQEAPTTVLEELASVPPRRRRMLTLQSARCAGDLGAAQAQAEEGVREAAHSDPWPLVFRGRLRMVCGELVLALADLDEAVRRSPPPGWPSAARGVARICAGDLAGALADLEVAAPGVRQADLWRLALGVRDVHASRLRGFDADLARCLRGELDEAALLEQAGAPTWGERSRRRRLRRARGLLGVAAEVRGDAAAAAAHAEAVRALGDDGSLECDWAWCRQARVAASDPPSAGDSPTVSP